MPKASRPSGAGLPICEAGAVGSGRRKGMCSDETSLTLISAATLPVSTSRSMRRVFMLVLMAVRAEPGS
jgi:hypothetical protein